MFFDKSLLPAYITIFCVLLHTKLWGFETNMAFGSDDAPFCKRVEMEAYKHTNSLAPQQPKKDLFRGPSGADQHSNIGDIRANF